MRMQSNPFARWHIGQGSVNSIAFSTDGAYLATVGRDGIMSIQYCLHCAIGLCFPGSSRILLFVRLDTSEI